MRWLIFRNILRIKTSKIFESNPKNTILETSEKIPNFFLNFQLLMINSFGVAGRLFHDFIQRRFTKPSHKLLKIEFSIQIIVLTFLDQFQVVSLISRHFEAVWKKKKKTDFL